MYPCSPSIIHHGQPPPIYDIPRPGKQHPSTHRTPPPQTIITASPICNNMVLTHNHSLATSVKTANDSFSPPTRPTDRAKWQNKPITDRILETSIKPTPIDYCTGLNRHHQPPPQPMHDAPINDKTPSTAPMPRSKFTHHAPPIPTAKARSQQTRSGNSSEDTLQPSKDIDNAHQVYDYLPMSLNYRFATSRITTRERPTPRARTIAQPQQISGCRKQKPKPANSSAIYTWSQSKIHVLNNHEKRQSQERTEPMPNHHPSRTMPQSQPIDTANQDYNKQLQARYYSLTTSGMHTNISQISNHNSRQSTIPPATGPISTPGTANLYSPNQRSLPPTHAHPPSQPQNVTIHSYNTANPIYNKQLQGTLS